jgi:hypothetical protein
MDIKARHTKVVETIKTQYGVLVREATTDTRSRNRISIWSTPRGRYCGSLNEPSMAIRMQIQFVSQASIALSAPLGMDLIARLTLRTGSCCVRPSQSKSSTLQWNPTLSEGRAKRPLRSEMTDRTGSCRVCCVACPLGDVRCALSSGARRPV